MGSKFICEKTTFEVPTAAIASWVDHDGIYYLREISETDLELPSVEKETIDHLIYQAGTSSAVWAIGSSVICKAKAWCEGMELESDTLAFVAANCPQILIPEVVDSWLDRGLNRTFLLLKRINNAQTLDNAWLILSSEQKHQAATTIAGCCRDIATLQSPLFQSATGRGLCERFLNVEAEDSHPSWKPRLLGPLSLPTFDQYLRRITSQTTRQPEVRDAFYSTSTTQISVQQIFWFLMTAKSEGL